jgi:hypothetical protein
MPVTIDLPPETEAKLREQAATQGAKFEEYLCELVQHWAHGNGTSPTSSSVEKTSEQRIAEWREFVASHDSTPAVAEEKTPQQRVAEFMEWANSHSHITAVADDSRESIYEGCGE